MSKVWFITGAGKGMGKSIVKKVLESGDKVVATSRKGNDIEFPEEYKDNALCLKLDISEPDEMIYADTVRKAVEKFDRIDVLVNNAGYGVVTFFEETDEATIGPDGPTGTYISRSGIMPWQVMTVTRGSNLISNNE